MARLVLAAALALAVAFPAAAQRIGHGRPIACRVVTGGGQYVVEGPCLRRLDALREMNRRAIERATGKRQSP